MPTPDSLSETTGRYVCVHGHFYQPPRENPWLETVERQDSAAPYHDWNERITAECYAPNGAARVVNAQNEIIRILNNYAHMSFNFGPTLLSWLEVNAHRVYRMILDADCQSRLRFSGHGSAVAQAYNHIIMPLASTRDRITQIRWGIADFQHRFGRKPEGMWLPETAVDTESLELLAAQGIRFVILAPSQCARVRPLVPRADAPAKTTGGKARRAARESTAAAIAAAAAQSGTAWRETFDASVDTTRPYLIRLKDDKSIAAYFYDGPRSRAIAFEGLLNDGETFARRLLGGFSGNAGHSQLVHVATDGESYGHHHRYGEMALAWALKWIEAEGHARITNYGEFLEKFPPVYEAQIVENTSWSCAHGVERWRSDCGCSSGRPGWNQQWRRPLRESLDWLRDTIAPLARAEGESLFIDFDEARNAYISVVLDRRQDSVDAFFAAHTNRALTPVERIRALELMELERHSMLMYTSCAWFFDEISGIETVQVIAYAGRVLQIAAGLFGEPGAVLEPQFIQRLSAAKSNIPEQQDGGAVYKRYIVKMAVDLEQVAAHYAISSIFSSYADQTELFCYTIRRQSYQVVSSGRGRLVIGQAHIRSNITEEQETVTFAVLHFGDQNIAAAVKRHDAPRTAAPEQAALDEEFVQAARTALIRADIPEVIRTLDRYFPGPTYSIQSLFRDEQQRILELILAATLSEVEGSLTSIYENQASLLHFLSQSGLPRPAALTIAATFAINAGLRRAILSEPIDAIQARAYLDLSVADQVTLDQAEIGYLAAQKMKRAMDTLQKEVAESTEQIATLENALLVARTVTQFPFELNLWQSQNLWYDAYRHSRRSWKSSQPEPGTWQADFLELGRIFKISVNNLVLEEEQPIFAPEPLPVVESAATPDPAQAAEPLPGATVGTQETPCHQPDEGHTIQPSETLTPIKPDEAAPAPGQETSAEKTGEPEAVETPA